MRKENIYEFTALLILLAFLWGCKQHSKEAAIIEGNFSHTAHSRLTLYRLEPNSTPLIDSTITDEQGNFLFKLSPLETSFYLLRKDNRNSIIIGVNKAEKIRVEGNGDDLAHTYTIEGSDVSVVLWKYNSLAVKSQDKIDSLHNILDQSQSSEEFPVIRKKLDSLYGVTYEANRKQVISFINQHISSLACLIIVNRSFGSTPVVTVENDLPLFSAIDTALAQKYRDNRNYIAFHNLVNKCNKEINKNTAKGSLAPGTIMPEISLPDSKGKPKKLSSLKGKVVLVYFWSSWNSTARETNVELTGLFEQYHARGFDIFGVSLDTDHKSWINACRIDRTAWVQVNDSSGLNSSIARNYRIGSLPSALLLDREGKVISGNVKFRELKALLLEKL